jgi:hypothetical protein
LFAPLPLLLAPRGSPPPEKDEVGRGIRVQGIEKRGGRAAPSCRFPHCAAAPLEEEELQAAEAGRQPGGANEKSVGLGQRGVGGEKGERKG